MVAGMTQEEADEWDRIAAIEEAITDATDDGEGHLSATRLEHHLAKRGFRIIEAPTPQGDE